MTDQEIFDKVVNHLRKQGGKAVNDDGECLYRAPHGKKCAFGCLMTDEEYTGRWEFRTARYLIDTEESLQRFAPHKELIYTLQKIHDATSYGVYKWEEKFKKCAEKFGLEYKPKVEDL
jgi:hypothetical protein